MSRRIKAKKARLPITENIILPTPCCFVMSLQPFKIFLFGNCYEHAKPISSCQMLLKYFFTQMPYGKGELMIDY